MANQQHLNIFFQSVKVWNKWRREHAGFVPDLSGADLSGTFLNGANLRGDNLSGTNLSGANLSGVLQSHL